MAMEFSKSRTVMFLVNLLKIFSLLSTTSSVICSMVTIWEEKVALVRTLGFLTPFSKTSNSAWACGGTGGGGTDSSLGEGAAWDAGGESDFSTVVL